MNISLTDFILLIISNKPFWKIYNENKYDLRPDPRRSNDRACQEIDCRTVFSKKIITEGAILISNSTNFTKEKTISTHDLLRWFQAKSSKQDFSQKNNNKKSIV